ncbi:MAG: hypothetical protein ACLFSB_08350 [Chitinispirillaceae bacterium]
MNTFFYIFSILLCSVSFSLARQTTQQDSVSDSAHANTPRQTHAKTPELLDSIPVAHQTLTDTVEDTLYEESVQQEPIPRSVSPMDSIPTTGSEAKKQYYDTLSSPLPDTAYDDTLRFLQTDTGSSDEQKSERPYLDTTIQMWQHPFWTMGVGWSLGGMPFFETWQDGLPDSSMMFVSQSDTVTSQIDVKEDFATYHTTFPLSVAYHIPTDTLRSMSVEIMAWTTGKRFEAVWEDSSVKYMEVGETIRLWNLEIGANYFLRIPDQFFSIDEVDRTYFTIGAFVAPIPILVYNSQQQGIAAGPGEDYTFIGKGVSWRAGLRAMREVERGRGIEVSVLYQGHWLGGFRDGDIPLKTRIFNPGSNDADEEVSFVAHRFTLLIRLLFGKRYSTEF